MALRRPPPEPADDRLGALHRQLAQAEQRARLWCSVACHHAIISRNPPPCAHPDATLCEMAKSRVAGLRRLIAREQEQQRGS